MDEPITLDARATRFDAGVIAALLLVAFVFDVRWLVPIAGADALACAVFGRAGAPFVRAFEEFVESHLGPTVRTVQDRAWRFAQAMTAVVIAVATLLVFGPASSIGWLVVLAIAMVAALDAAAGISIGRWVHRRWLTRG